MSYYDSNAKGLKICAIIWLILILLGSLIGAIIAWKAASFSSTFVGIGFGILFGGGFVAALGYFFLSCIADIAQKSYESEYCSSQKSSSNSTNSSAQSNEAWTCPNCGKVHASYVCSCSCGTRKPTSKR